jgi:hypothetical protein
LGGACGECAGSIIHCGLILVFTFAAMQIAGFLLEPVGDAHVATCGEPALAGFLEDLAGLGEFGGGLGGGGGLGLVGADEGKTALTLTIPNPHGTEKKCCPIVYGPNVSHRSSGANHAGRPTIIEIDT